MMCSSAVFSWPQLLPASAWSATYRMLYRNATSLYRIYLDPEQDLAWEVATCTKDGDGGPMWRWPITARREVSYWSLEDAPRLLPVRTHVYLHHLPRPFHAGADCVQHPCFPARRPGATVGLTPAVPVPLLVAVRQAQWDLSRYY